MNMLMRSKWAHLCNNIWTKKLDQYQIIALYIKNRQLVASILHSRSVKLLYLKIRSKIKIKVNLRIEISTKTLLIKQTKQKILYKNNSKNNNSKRTGDP